jgi:hypothetical protein
VALTSQFAPPRAAIARPAPNTDSQRRQSSKRGTSCRSALDGNSFASRAALESEWNYLYPWGSDHNGTARMYASSTDSNHLFLSPAGQLNIKATRITWDEGVSDKDPHLPIRYHSAAIHAKNQIVVNDTYPSYEIRGEFQAPSARGTWPASTASG